MLPRQKKEMASTRLGVRTQRVEGCLECGASFGSSGLLVTSAVATEGRVIHE